MRSSVKGWLIPIVWILTIVILLFLSSFFTNNPWGWSPLFVFLGAMVARFVYERMYPATMLSYKMMPDLKQILVKFNNTKTIVLKNGSKRIELHIVNGGDLWIQDSKFHGSSVVIGAIPTRGRSVSLVAGNFFITKDATGYIISWEESDWEVAPILG